MPLTLISRGILTVPAVVIPPSHSVAYTNFIARTSGLDTTHLNAYADLLDGLTSDGLFNLDGTSSYLDCLYIWATQGSTTANLNLVSTSFTCTSAGFPTFVADQGYNFASGNDVDTNFNASTAGGHYARTSACMGIWCYDAPGNSPHLSAGTGENLYPGHTGVSYFRVNDNPETGSFSTGAPAGFYLGNRDGSTSRQAYVNGSSVGTYGSSPDQALVNATFLRTVVSGLKTSAIVLGGSLNSTLAGNLYSRLRTYMTAVGVP